MTIRTSIARVLAALALASGVALATGLGTGAPLAHAAVGGGPCTAISCYPQPSLTLSDPTIGQIVIRGANWSPNHWVELDTHGTYALSDYVYWVLTDSKGSFVFNYYENSLCPYALQVWATDNLWNTYVYSYFGVC